MMLADGRQVGLEMCLSDKASPFASLPLLKTSMLWVAQETQGQA